MLLFRMLACTAAAAALLTAMPAAAIVKVATYTGTIRDGIDETGVFGAAGSDLAGLSYVATYTYDRALGFLITDGVHYDESYGGTFPNLAASPVISATLTINGITKILFGEWEGYIQTGSDRQNFSVYSVTHSAISLVDDGTIFRVHNIYNIANIMAPASLNQNWGPVTQAGSGHGEANIYYYDLATAKLVESVYAYLNADGTYSVTDLAPVTEPSAWALMIAGFGLVGAALRRRERLAAA